MEPESKETAEQQSHQEGLKHFLGALGLVICLLGVLLGGKYLKFNGKEKDFHPQKIFSSTICQNTGNIIIVYNNSQYTSEIEINKKREKDKKAISVILERVGIAHDEIVKYSSFVEKYDEDLELKRSIIEAEDLIFSLKYQLPIEQLISIIKNSKIEDKYKNNLLDSLGTEKQRLLKIWRTEAKDFPTPKNFESALKQQKKLNEDLISKIESGGLEEKYKNEILKFLRGEYEKFLSRLKFKKPSGEENAEKNITKSKDGKLFKSVDTLVIQTQDLNKFKGVKKIIGSILAENDMSGNISINNPSGKMLYIEFEMIPDKLLEVLEDKYPGNVQKMVKKNSEAIAEDKSIASENDFNLNLALESETAVNEYVPAENPDMLQNDTKQTVQIAPQHENILKEETPPAMAESLQIPDLNMPVHTEEIAPSVETAPAPSEVPQITEVKTATYSEKIAIPSESTPILTVISQDSTTEAFSDTNGTFPSETS